MEVIWGEGYTEAKSAQRLDRRKSHAFEPPVNDVVRRTLQPRSLCGQAYQKKYPVKRALQRLARCGRCTIILSSHSEEPK